MLPLFCIIASFMVESLHLSPNIAYNGPFNTYQSYPHRRRILSNTDTLRNVAFHHGVASGDPTDHDLIVRLSIQQLPTQPFNSQLYPDLDSNNTSISKQIRSRSG